MHSLIKPKRSIPESLSTLTGISNDMMRDAPFFEDIAADLFDVLQGSVFVAHNARFDYGFIKNAFKSCGVTYQASVRTIKLVKQLYPNLKYYNLAFIAQSFNVTLRNHHRAQADSAVLLLGQTHVLKLSD